MLQEKLSVDAHTEARIAERLAAARRGRSTLVVTASPLVLEHADEVLLLRDGVVRARGTHHEMLAATTEAGHHYRTIVGRSLDEDDDRADERRTEVAR